MIFFGPNNQNNIDNLARQAIESQYDSKCDVIEKKKKEVKNITKNVEEKVLTDKPCRVSFEDIYVNTETNTEAKKVQKIKLFIAPELDIKPGSKIIVLEEGELLNIKIVENQQYIILIKK